MKENQTSKEKLTMSKLIENKVVYVAVCALFVLAVCTSISVSGAIPSFGASLLPESTLICLWDIEYCGRLKASSARR